MEHDPQSTDGRTPAAPYDGDRPVAAGAARQRPYPALAAVGMVLLLSALVFGALAARPRQGGGAVTATVTPSTTTPQATSTATPLPQPLPAGMPVISLAMVSADDGWAIAGPTATSGP